MGKKQIKVKKDVLDKINGEKALEILRVLAKEDENVAKKIEQTLFGYLREVDVENVASQVYFSLDGIAVEDVWDNSGSTRYGYEDPTEVAWQMFEDELKPFMDELKNYMELSMHNEAKKYCMGMLKGLYKFEKESCSEYSDWAEDAPKDYFETVLDYWKKGCKNQKDIKEMEEFIQKNFLEWQKKDY